MLAPFFGALWALTLPGCGGARTGGEWEIVLDNQTKAACSATVSYRGSGAKGSASVDGPDPGRPTSLVAGPGSTTVESVKVKVGGNETMLTPNAEIKPGHVFKITIAPSGEVTTAILKK